MPGDILGAGCFQYPSADGHYHARFFGYRNELRGGYRTKIRVIPAQQSFHAGYFAGFEIQLGLIVKENSLRSSARRRFVSIDRRSLAIRLNIFGVKLVVVLAFLFGKIHGDIGIFHHGLFILSVFGVNADADAGRHAAFFTHKNHRFDSGCKYFVGHDFALDSIRLRPRSV